MLKWTIAFLLIAAVAGLLGFSNGAATAVGIAKIIFLVLLLKILAILFFVLVIGSFFVGRNR
jgi:uncharacterized membrane protein YtjA (UPF0391 family)